jgi:hypothetical protein
VRERQVAGRAAGPRGPQRRGGDLQSRQTGNGSVMSWDRRGNLKSYDDPSLTIAEIEELETKGIGGAIGGGPGGQNPDEVVDRNGNGVIFDGTPDERPAARKKPKKDDRLAKRRAALESSDRDMGPKSTQMNQRNERIDRSVAREQMRGWEPTANGRGLKPAAGRRGAMGPAGPRSRSGVVSTEPGSRFSPATRPAKGSETRWAPGAADAPRRPKR